MPPNGDIALQHPLTGRQIKVPANTVDRWLAAGWQAVKAAAEKPAETRKGNQK